MYLLNQFSNSPLIVISIIWGFLCPVEFWLLFLLWKKAKRSRQSLFLFFLFVSVVHMRACTWVSGNVDSCSGSSHEEKTSTCSLMPVSQWMSQRYYCLKILEKKDTSMHIPLTYCFLQTAHANVIVIKVYQAGSQFFWWCWWEGVAHYKWPTVAAPSLPVLRCEGCPECSHPPKRCLLHTVLLL